VGILSATSQLLRRPLKDRMRALTFTRELIARKSDAKVGRIERQRPTKNC